MHAAILVGIGTVLADDPRLTVRLADGAHPQPVVLDTHLRCPPAAALFAHPTRRPWLLCGPEADPARERALTSAGARVIRLAARSNGHVDLGAALACLATAEVDSLMVEGGAGVITAFLAERRVDFVILTIVPVFVGGVHAVTGAPDADPARLPRLHDMGHARLGDDLIIWARPDNNAGQHSAG